MVNYTRKHIVAFLLLLAVVISVVATWRVLSTSANEVYSGPATTQNTNSINGQAAKEVSTDSISQTEPTND